MKKIYRVMIVFGLFLMSGCDVLEDIWNTLVGFLNTYWSDFICYMYGIVLSVWQKLVDSFCMLVTPLLEVLPQYTPPSLNLSGIEFVQYSAYFLPISESATMIKYLLMFYMSFWFGRLILRWLKILR